MSYMFASSEQDQDGTEFRPDPARKLSANLCDILVYHCCVYSGGKKKTPDDGQRNCPKHVDFYSKNKFEKLVHLVGFIIRIYHDARSPECQVGEELLAPPRFMEPECSLSGSQHPDLLSNQN